MKEMKFLAIVFLTIINEFSVNAQKMDVVVDWMAPSTIVENNKKVRVVYIISADGGISLISETGSTRPFTQLSDIKKITSNGLDYAVALKNDGTVWTWGNNDDGKLGNYQLAEKNGRLYKFTDSDAPVKVDGLSGVMAISAFKNTSYAVCNDGTVWAWGHANGGLTGNGKIVLPPMTHTEGSFVVQPQKVVGLTDAVAVSGPMALLADGSVWTWGPNNYGQLGNGNTTPSSRPLKVPGLSNIVAISANVNGNRMALSSDGSVWTWGTNMHGLLGQAKGDEKYSTIPAKAKGIQNAIAISAGRLTNLALLKNGTIMGWGDGRLASLGMRGREDTQVPVIVPGVKNAAGLQAAIYSGYALLDDGSIMGWGDLPFLSDRKAAKIGVRE